MMMTRWREKPMSLSNTIIRQRNTSSQRLWTSNNELFYLNLSRAMGYCTILAILGMIQLFIPSFARPLALVNDCPEYIQGRRKMFRTRLK
mmetsp:Transcript_77/g.145  ORF Transcript_77/g.145 Transcript_77/m.145 type:complete len:90 (+) Transcript_77:710-979(+)